LPVGKEATEGVWIIEGFCDGEEMIQGGGEGVHETGEEGRVVEFHHSDVNGFKSLDIKTGESAGAATSAGTALGGEGGRMGYGEKAAIEKGGRRENVKQCAF